MAASVRFGHHPVQVEVLHRLFDSNSPELHRVFCFSALVFVECVSCLAERQAAPLATSSRWNPAAPKSHVFLRFECTFSVLPIGFRRTRKAFLKRLERRKVTKIWAKDVCSAFRVWFYLRCLTLPCVLSCGVFIFLFSERLIRSGSDYYVLAFCCDAT